MKEVKAHDYKTVYEDLGLDLSKLGCVMLDVEPLDNMYSIDLEGAGVALYYAKNKSRFWIDGWVIDKTAHVTVLYGLLHEANNYKKHIQKVTDLWSIESVEIEDITFFDSPYEDEPYWCLVAKVKKTRELMEGHERLSLLPHVDTFGEYKPHITIAYIDKSQDEEYRDNLIEHFKILWVGKKLKTKKELNLGGN